MAEMTEKIYCYDRPSDNSGLLAELINANGKSNNADAWAYMNGGGFGNMWNNPFMYLIWLAMFGNNGFGWNNRGDNFAQGIQNNEFMSRLNSIENQMQDNHANQLAMDAIKGNGQALHELAGNLNVGVAELGRAISNVRSAIERVGGDVGMTGERVINSVIIGNKDLIKAVGDCCCNTNQNITRMGYEGQIRDMQNTGVISKEIDCLGHSIGDKMTAGAFGINEKLTGLGYTLSDQINRVNTGLERGFSTLAYENQKQTCDIINAGKDNTQRIIDTLNHKWQSDTSQALQDAKFEVSQLKQTQYLASKINGDNSTSLW